MKRNITLLPLILITFLIVLSGCPEDTKGPNDLNLDENLFGLWVFETEDDFYSWRFNNNGTCIQNINGQEFNWKWEIVSAQIKFFVDFGTPHYKTYKIVHDKLYLWVDEINDWGLPFTKQGS